MQLGQSDGHLAHPRLAPPFMPQASVGESRHRRPLRTTRASCPAPTRRLLAMTSRRVGRAFSSSTVCGRRACRSLRDPPGDAGNNPCRRQGDQVVAPGSTGRRLLIEDDCGASRRRRHRAARLRGGRRRRSVVLSQGARPRMGVPVGRGPLGHTQYREAVRSSSLPPPSLRPGSWPLLDAHPDWYVRSTAAEPGGRRTV